MDYVIMDLEWNNAYSKRIKKCINEIIEIGAVRISDTLEVSDEFSRCIKPQISKELSGRVRSLTNITSDELNVGISFTEAIREFRGWMGDAVLGTWGTTDITVLIENYKYYTGSSQLKFLTKYIDIQNYCQNALGHPAGKSMGLLTAAQAVGIKPEGLELHRALADSILTIDVLKHVYQDTSFSNLIHNAGCDEFYRWISFKTSYICDLNHPAINGHFDMSFRCTKCGARAKRKTAWELKNKGHRATFVCNTCGERFIGRIQFKQKYDGVVMSKRIVEQPLTPNPLDV